MKRINKGFTMVELLITMFIAAILLAFATPSFVDLIERTRVKTTAENVVELMRMSRLVAVENRTIVSVCGSSDSENCDNDWGTSIIAIKRGQDADDADQLLASISISEKLSITKTNQNNPNVDFRVNGWTPWDQTTISICPVDGKEGNAYQVVVSQSGKIKMRANLDGESWC